MRLKDCEEEWVKELKRGTIKRSFKKIVELLGAEHITNKRLKRRLYVVGGNNFFESSSIATCPPDEATIELIDATPMSKQGGLCKEQERVVIRIPMKPSPFRMHASVEQHKSKPLEFMSNAEPATTHKITLRLPSMTLD